MVRTTWTAWKAGLGTSLSTKHSPKVEGAIGIGENEAQVPVELQTSHVDVPAQLSWLVDKFRNRKWEKHGIP